MDSYSQRSGAGPSNYPKPSQPATKQKSPTCDRCRELKIRCAFNQGKDQNCTNCVGRKFQCTWMGSTKPLPPPDESYTEYLEERVQELEQRLKQIFPGINPRREIDSLLNSEPPASSQSQPSHSPGRSTITAVPPRPLLPYPPAVPSQAIPTPATAATSTTTTGSQFIQKARLVDVRSEVASTNAQDNDDTLWSDTPSALDDEPHYHGLSSAEILSRDAGFLREGFLPSLSHAAAQTHRRPEFWRPTTAEMRMQSHNPWEPGPGPEPELELPPDDLMPELIDEFFDKTNSFYPMLHRPLFEKQLSEGLHLREPTFMRVVMLVCANGARWSHDPRVWEDKWPVTLSAGYRWFKQVQSWNSNLAHRSSLWDVQIMLLTVIFLHGSSTICGVWTIIGTGIRVLVDAGAHRKRSTVSIENELYKRCFWSFLLLDRLTCFITGRQSAMQDLDSDLDDVLEVDDEYWSLEPNAPPPVQPEGLPSRFAMFNRVIGLGRLMSRGLQTVLALGRTKRQVGLDGPQADIWMMQDMNTQLNLWAHSIPPHLRLPHPSQYHALPYLDQTVSMWSMYFYIVQATNRQFIAQTSPLALSCLRICREAAHACARMLHAHRLTPGSRPLPSSFTAVFSSAMILVIDLIVQDKAARLAEERGDSRLDLGAGGSGGYTVQQKEEDVKRCMDVLERAEGTFHVAGRLHDLLREFEESWRLQLSRGARSARSAGTGTSGSSSNSTGQQQTRQTSESVLPPLLDVQPKLEDKADVTFDISYPRPSDNLPAAQNDVPPTVQYDVPVATRHDAPSATQHYMPPMAQYGIRQQADQSLPVHVYAGSTAHPRGVMSGSYPPESCLPNYQPETYGSAPGSSTRPHPASYSASHSGQTWNNPARDSSSFDPTYSGQRTYLPEDGYPYITSPLQQPEIRISKAFRPDQSYTNAFLNNSPGFNIESTAIPGLGVFPPGGWMLALNEERSNADGMVGGRIAGPVGNANLNSKKPARPMLAQWDTLMRNTMNLSKWDLDLFRTSGHEI